MPKESVRTPFKIRDCSLMAISLGQRAQTMRGLADRIHIVPAVSIYYHFWGGLLRPRFDDAEFNNDFASWAHYALHDDILAERLGIIDPASFEDLEDLRQELVDVLEARIYELEVLIAAKPDHKFEFLQAQTVVFDSDKQLRHPEELAEVVPQLSTSSIYYHFIDARWRNESGEDDFRAWLRDAGDQYAPVRTEIAEIDPYFTNLVDLRDELSALFRRHFGGNS